MLITDPDDAGHQRPEHRGDGHVAALLTVGIGGTEAHVLHALSEGMPAENFGRVSHLPRAQLAAVVDGRRARGLVGADGWLTATGRQTKERVETLTDELAYRRHARHRRRDALVRLLPAGVADRGRLRTRLVQPGPVVTVAVHIAKAVSDREALGGMWGGSVRTRWARRRGPRWADEVAAKTEVRPPR